MVVQFNLIVPAYPPNGVMVRSVLAELPALTVMLLSLAESAKSAIETVTAVDEEEPKSALPLYFAVMVSFPAASVAVVNVATPEELTATVASTE
jgi:hypothetical protein